LPETTKRRGRTPGFMARLPTKSEHPLFGEGGREPELMFTAIGDHGDDAPIGAASLAPPLPPPPAHLTIDVAERLTRAIRELEHRAERVGAEVAATALEIGCLIARRILEAELKTDRAAFRSLVQSAVRRLGDAHKVVIHLAPVDVEMLRAGTEAPAATLGIARVEIIADTNLTPGDCLVESDAATVDGRLGTRLEEVRRVLSESINGHGDVA
jgi:flagellar biosynthesis/type III secretory pathway protein FliH